MSLALDRPWRRSRMGTSKAKMALGGVAALVAVAAAPTAQAQDFFSALFGALGVHRPQPPSTPLSYDSDGNVTFPPEGRQRVYGGSSQAYCVRTCDGRC